MDLTEDDKMAAQQLRDRIADLQITDKFRIADFNMIRFLRARGMDMDKAEDMYRKYIGWRRANDIDNAVTWDVAKDLHENFRYRIVGLSRNGGLVVCVNIGDWNPHLAHGRYEEIMQVAYNKLENLTHFAKYFMAKKNRFNKMVAVLNLEGLTFAHCSTMEWIRAMITMLKAFESYYPETLKVAFLINAPWVFSILWSIAKPFISNSTHERLRFLGADKDSWKSEILEYVEEDQFPEKFGGTLPDDHELVFEDGKVIGKRNPDTNENNEPVSAMKSEQSQPQQKGIDSIELD